MSCEFLDDYLDRSLTESESARFSAHLDDCATCRQIVGEYERLNDILSEAVVESAPLPHGLIHRIEEQIHRARRRRRIYRIAGLVAAASLLACILSAWWLFRPSNDVVITELRPTLPEKVIASVAPVKVAFHRPDQVITRRIETKNPDVTIIWVYPAQTTQAYPRSVGTKHSNRSGT